jgi:outer membrane protein assembly factor BamB
MSETQDRLLALVRRYLTALYRGDFDTVAHILTLAEGEPDLERALLAAHDAYLRRHDLAVPSGDAAHARDLVLQRVGSPPSAAVGVLPHGTASRSAPVLARAEDAVLPLDDPAPRTPPPPLPPARRSRSLGAQLDLAATALLVVVLLAGFFAVYAGHGVTQPPTPVVHGPNTSYAGPVLLAGTQDGSVVALRADSGAVVWSWGDHQTVDALVRSADVVYVTSHPATSSGFDPITRLTALRVRDGTQLWQTTEPQLQGYTYMSFYGNTLLAASNYGDGTVYALDTGSGHTRWTYTNTSNRQDILVTSGGGVAYMAGISEGFTALDDRTGHFLWTFDRPGVIASLGNNGPSIVPASGGGLVYYYYSDLVSAYGSDTPAVVTLDAASGVVRNTLIVGQIGHPVLITPAGVAYTGSTGQLCAFRIAGAVRLWCDAAIDPTSNISLRLTPTSGGLFYSLIVGDTNGGPVEVGSLDPATGATRWTWHGPSSLASASNAMSLVTGSGALYLTTGQGVYAFNPSNGHLLWHALPTADFSFIAPAAPPA